MISVINRGDNVNLCINTIGIFNDIAERNSIWGQVAPEEGYPGFIEFNNTGTYNNNVIDLFCDI